MQNHAILNSYWSFWTIKISDAAESKTSMQNPNEFNQPPNNFGMNVQMPGFGVSMNQNGMNVNMGMNMNPPNSGFGKN